MPAIGNSIASRTRSKTSKKPYTRSSAWIRPNYLGVIKIIIPQEDRTQQEESYPLLAARIAGADEPLDAEEEPLMYSPESPRSYVMHPPSSPEHRVPKVRFQSSGVPDCKGPGCRGGCARCFFGPPTY